MLSTTLPSRYQPILKVRVSGEPARIYELLLFVCCLFSVGTSKTKLLEQPIPASFLKLEERVRYLGVSCKYENSPPVLKEQVFMYEYDYYLQPV